MSVMSPSKPSSRSVAAAVAPARLAPTMTNESGILDLQHEIVVIHANRVGLDGLWRWRRQHRSGCHVELCPMTPACHDGSVERPLLRERALLMRACVINREESPVRIRHRDAAAGDLEQCELAWLDVGLLGEG